MLIKVMPKIKLAKLIIHYCKALLILHGVTKLGMTQDLFHLEAGLKKYQIQHKIMLLTSCKV